MSDNFSEDSSDSEEDINFIGKLLNNRYILISIIGKGTFAIVYLSYDLINNNFYAIKVQNCEDYDSGIKEVDALNKIKSSKCKYLNKIINNFEYEYDDEIYICMVFELLAGSVYDLIKKGKYSNGLPIEIVKIILKQTLIAIEVLNRDYNILHTDLKPENILIKGISVKTQHIINKFNELFSKYFNKKNINLKNKDYIEKTFGKLIIVLNNQLELENKQNENINKDIVIEDKYLNPDILTIQLSDLGTYRSLNETPKYFRIQTRYYRSPEVILEYDYNETCDVWSIGCILYELLTGRILFNPEKSPRINTNRSHLLIIQSFFGQIPEYILNNSKKTKYYFNLNGTFKGVNNIKHTSLLNLLQTKIKNNNFVNLSDNDIYTIADLLYKIFNYNIQKRIKINQILEHPFFS